MQLFTAPPTVDLTQAQFLGLQPPADYTNRYKTSDTQTLSDIASAIRTAMASFPAIPENHERVIRFDSEAPAYYDFENEQDILNTNDEGEVTSRIRFEDQNGIIVSRNPDPIPDSYISLDASTRITHYHLPHQQNIQERVNNLIHYAVRLGESLQTYSTIEAIRPQGTWQRLIANSSSSADIIRACRNAFWTSFANGDFNASEVPRYLVVANESETLSELVEDDIFRRTFILPDGTTETIEKRTEPDYQWFGFHTSGGDTHLAKERSFLHALHPQIREIFEYHKLKGRHVPSQYPHIYFRFTS